MNTTSLKVPEGDLTLSKEVKWYLIPVYAAKDITKFVTVLGFDLLITAILVCFLLIPAVLYWFGDPANDLPPRRKVFHSWIKTTTSNWWESLKERSQR